MKHTKTQHEVDSMARLYTVQLKFQPTYPCVIEIFVGKQFHPCNKDRHRLYVFNAGKKLWNKILPMRAVGLKKKR